MPTANRYHPHVLAALLSHGIRPRPTTDPRFAYEVLKSIYTFEIRGLRGRRWEKERVMGPQPLDDYRRGLAAIKARYRILQVPPQHWVERQTPDPTR